ncbi:MAG: carbohydrate binding family 9 domain-containing protein [Acidobacteria bacterium]|nr:carbohydrate binding family 9 domain-containing protein [Acidobacteriota bacterium]
MRHRIRRSLGGLLASWALPLLLAGTAADVLAQPVVTAVRVVQPPVIDGLLDDDAWTDAARLSTFVQTAPVEGAAASEPTDVYLVYDGENLYVGVRARYGDTGLMRANRADRDQIAEDDTVSLFFDPFRDRQRAYQFTVNGFGVQGDAILNSTGLRNRTQRRAIGARGGGASDAPPSGIPEGDISWDALFLSAGAPSDDGWTAEMAIPFRSLRYPAVEAGESHRWGFQVSRTVKGKDETVVWSPVSRDIAQFLAQMGVLDGLANLSTARNLEILPTVTALRTGSLDTAGAFTDNDVAEAGLNVKYGLSSDLTADFTINPDFSQIESDLPQIDVNQRFPLFYPELRPFFLEGQEIFNVFAPITPIHTRTIIDPRYGGKVSGKVGRSSVGVLFADDEAPGKRDDPSDPAFGRTANVAIGRARFDLYPESFVGATVTNRNFMDSYSRMLAFDSNMRLGATNRWNVFVSRAWHRDEKGIERRGEAMGTFFNHLGRNVNFSAFYGGTTPDFRIDTGFVRRVDDKRMFTNLSYRWWPEHWLVNWGPRLRYGRNYSFENVLMDETVGGGLDFTFARNVRLGLSAERALERYGGIDFWKWNHGVDFDVNASRRVALVGSFTWGESIRYSGMPFLGRGRLGSLTAIFRPASRLQSQLNVELSRLDDPRTETLVFDIRVLRALTTFQFTERFLIRNIMEYNSFDGTIDGNLLLTYRVNSGTVFYLGYDGHYQQEDRLDPLLYVTDRYRQTNRAIFTKISYLFRY